MFSLPPGWTWPNVITAIISMAAFVLSLATFVQRHRLNPQPKLVPDWGRGDIVPSAFEGVTDTRDYTPCATLWVRNHGDAAARDVHASVSTLPDGGINTSRDIVDGGEALGPVEVPLTKQTTMEFNLDGFGNYGYVLTEPPDKVKYERPVVTITWREPPFSRKPRTKRLKVPKHLLGPTRN